ncbi:MAG: hypothetical protein R3321_01915 [Nitrososphaeraceae archaeon]|nr:hypothetical protein [Nitrososphaeraceae archaeon]
MALIKPITKSQYIVFINGIELYFTTFSGISDTAQTGSYANGTGNRIFKVVGARELDDVTLSMPYDPDAAKDLEDLWNDYECEYLTIVVQPTTCGNNPQNLGNPYILEGCLLSGLNVGEVDKESGDVSMIELSFTVNSWRRD